jgi:hypothetical protein
MTQWSDLRQEAIDAFDEHPSLGLENDVIELTEQLDANVVRRAIGDVALDKTRGKVRSSCWGLLRAKLKQATSGPSRDFSVRDQDVEYELAVVAAEREIRNALCHCDRESELLDALFGLGGKLRRWSTDTHLQEHMLELWRRERPRVERVEREEAQRIAAARQLRIDQERTVREEAERRKEEALAAARDAEAALAARASQLEAPAEVAHA